jgi:TRAP-type C4-dicarboxylate transport system permease small subunit
MTAFLARLDHGLAQAYRWVVIACFLGLFALLSLGILQRTFPMLKVPGYDELVELLFVWMTFIGSVALWREGTLYRVELLERSLGPTGRRVLETAIHACMLFIALVLSYAGWDFLRQSGETAPFLQIDKMWWHAAIPVSGSLMALYSIAALWRALRGELQETPQALPTLS